MLLYLVKKPKIELDIDERYLLEVIVELALNNGHLRNKINKAIAKTGKSREYVEEVLLKKVGFTGLKDL